LFKVKTEINNDGAAVKTGTQEEFKREYEEEYKEECKEAYKEEYKEEFKEEFKGEYEEEYKEEYIEEFKEEHKDDFKDEFKDEFKGEYEEEYKEEYKKDFEEERKDEADDLDGESSFGNLAVLKKEDIVDEKSQDSDMITGMNLRFVCQKELSDKSFIKAKALGSDWNRVCKKKDLSHVKTDARPCEEDLVNAVKDYFASLKSRKMKHILAHLQTLYGKGEFQKFGFGTFIEFAKKHGFEDQSKALNQQRKKTTAKIKKIIRKIKTPRGMSHYFCDPCGADLNINNLTDQDCDKRREVREHIVNLHSAIYSQVSQQIGQARTNDMIEEILRNLRSVNNNAKEDILSRLSAMFFRSGNIYHCIICGNKPIGREKKQAMEHLSLSHDKEEMAMRELIKLKYDAHVDKNFEKFLRLVLHKVESF